MKEKLLKTYYCGYCNKHYHRINSAIEHEKKCTLNPDRVCNLCQNGSMKDVITKYSKYKIDCKSMDEFYQTGCKVVWEDVELSLKTLMEDVDDCPVCALSVIRCAKLNDIGFSYEFNYKEELKNWWKEENANDCRSYSVEY